MKRLFQIIAFPLALTALLLPLLNAPLTQAAPADQTFSVNSTSDRIDTAPGDGFCHDVLNQCTLRAAVMEAYIQSNIHPSTSYTIVLPTNLVAPTIYPLTIHGTGEDGGETGDLDIKSRITIIRTLPGAAIIDAAGLNDRVFDIAGSGALTLVGITVQNGGGVRVGAGINAHGPLTLTSSAVLSSTASSPSAPGLGGGIFADGPRFVLDRSVVRGNSVVVTGSVPFGYGGGVYSSAGDFVITGSQVLANRVVITATSSGEAQGGGILARFGSFTATNSVINGNLVRPSGASATGAGLYLEAASARLYSVTVSSNTTGPKSQAGGIFAVGGQLDIDRSTLNANSASQAAGGLYVSGTVTLRDSTVSNNQGGNAGGVYVHSGQALNVQRSMFSLNSAQLGGGIENGGLLTLTNSTLFLNESSGSGAGLWNDGLAHLNNDTFLSNISQFNCAPSCGTGDGGGIWNSVSGAVLMRNTVLDNIDSGGEAPDCSGSITVLDYNLIHNTTGCTLSGDIGQHNLKNVASGLQFPANNGGPTLTSAPTAISLLIEAGNPGGCVDANGALLLTDQRGYPRTADSDRNGITRCDIGAYETDLELYLPLLRR